MTATLSPAETTEAPREAVLRRRANRAAVAAIRRQREDARQQQQAAADASHRQLSDLELRRRSRVARMIRGLRQQGTLHPIQMRYEYWLAVLCGWDFTQAEFARDRLGASVHPEMGSGWLWWLGLHYESRQMLVRASSRRCIAREGAEGEEDFDGILGGLLAKFGDPFKSPVKITQKLSSIIDEQET